MVLRLAWDEQYYTQDDFLLWYGRERGFEIWEEAGNVEDSDAQHVDHEIYTAQSFSMDKQQTLAEEQSTQATASECLHFG